MAFNNSTLVIVIVVAFAFYLIYSQTSQQKVVVAPQPVAVQPNAQIQNVAGNQAGQGLACPNCDQYKHKLANIESHRPNPPQVTNVVIDQDNDPYSDPIKKQDLYSMYDPLTYPQLRLPREVLEKYNEYYERTGTYPPFGQATQPMFDNPVLNGVLIKQVDENEPFSDNVPSSVPLFRVKSAKNTNRYFYYIVDQRYLSKIELKIPLDHVKINGVRYNNADFYGLPEIYDGDCIEGIPIYPTSKFIVKLYKTYHFP
jgi:hypothetical protein